MAWSFRPGMNTRHQTKHGIEGNDGGAAVADEGQSQADNRGNADAHTHIDNDLEHQCGGCAEADHAPHIVLAAAAYLNTAEHD